MKLATNATDEVMRALQQGQVESLAPSVKALKRFSETFTPDPQHADDEPAYEITLDVVLDDGRFVVETMTCTQVAGGPPVTSEGVRAVPVARLLAIAAFQRVVVTESAGSGYKISPFMGVDLDEDRKAGPTDAVLRKLAVVYQVHYACGLAPTRAVEEAFDLPRSTAGRWVALARERGFLGPASPDASGTRTSSTS